MSSSAACNVPSLCDLVFLSDGSTVSWIFDVVSTQDIVMEQEL
jgi:hypothetical protein